MTCVDLLSDTTYCEQAVQQLDQQLGRQQSIPRKAHTDLRPSTSRQAATRRSSRIC